MSTALITGITGQDGSYLAEDLLNRGYEVHGIIRRGSTFNTQRIEGIYQDPHEDDLSLYTHYGDMTDASNLSRLVEEIEPDEIYHLAAQSNVSVSFQQPEYTSDVNAIGTLRLLDAIKEENIETRFYNASTSELFGGASDEPFNEKSEFYPKSPYGASKLFSHWITIIYREAFDIFACNGICFNHESPRRGKRFVTRKISRAVAKIDAGIQDKVYLGNLEAKRDWGYAPEYVEMMWEMLQQDQPDDYVIATGETHTVREFVEHAFANQGYDIVWEGQGANQKGIDRTSGQTLVEIDPNYFRPSEVETLIGDPSKAEAKLGWNPETKFEELVKIMVEEDVKTLKQDGEVALDYLV